MNDKSNKSEYGEFIVVGVIVGLIFSGIGTFLWQVYHFLRFDEWTSLSLVDALRWCDLPWAYLPTEWVGLYRVLDFIPLSISLLVSSVCVFLWASYRND